MTAIAPGDRVIARSADNQLLERRAVTGVVMGEDFPIVWVCREEKWEAANAAGHEPEGVPWPAEDVKPLEAVS